MEDHHVEAVESPQAGRTETDIFMRLAWLSGIVVIGFIGVEVVTGFNPVDADAPWFVALKFVPALGLWASMFMYVRRHLEPRRFRLLSRSPLLYEIALLLTIYVTVSIAWPDEGRQAQDVASCASFFIAMIISVVLDACNSTPFEHRVSLVIMAVGIVAALVGCSFLWADTLITEGWEVDASTGLGSGRFGKNSIRQKCLFTLLFLIFDALLTALEDKDHVLLYYVKTNLEFKPTAHEQLNPATFQQQLDPAL